MKEYSELLDLVNQRTGASPIVAKCLLSIGGLENINLNTLIAKVSNNNIEKIFKIIKIINSNADVYFSVIKNIKENEKFLTEISNMNRL